MVKEDEMDINVIVEEYIKNRELELKIKHEQEKIDKLDALGLYRKVYDESGTNNLDEYPFSETKYVDGRAKDRLYKKVYPNISDEEYNKLKELTKNEAKTTIPNSLLQEIWTYTAWVVFVGGFLAGVFIGLDYESFLMALVYWVSAFISGILFLSLAEILKLLDHIEHK